MKHMLNKERIRIMTKLAAYEQNEGKKYLPMSKYYRKDYVGVQMIKTFICSTLAFMILFLLQILYGLDSWIAQFYQLSMVEIGNTVFIQYIIFVLVYQMIAFVHYNHKYSKGRKSIKQYQAKLKKIEKLYEREEKLHSVDE